MSNENMKVLSIDEILAADDVSYMTVQAWGGSVRLGSLDAGTMLDFIEANDGPAKRTAGIRLVIKSLVDAQGNRIGKMDMMEAFKKKNSRIFNQLVEAILILNGLGKDGVDVSSQLRAAGQDPDKLQKLSAELRNLADRIDDAGTDEVRLRELLESKPKADVVKND
jgi:hypothetical protein